MVENQVISCAVKISKISRFIEKAISRRQDYPRFRDFSVNI